MVFDDAKRAGFLVDFAWFQASETRAKDKEVPVHVYEHTLSRSGLDEAASPREGGAV